MRGFIRHYLPVLFTFAVLMAFSSAWAAKSFIVTSTAYTSSVRETDSTPFITATGARTRFGIVAVSRDLLPMLPYGSQVRLEDLGSVSGRGRGQFDYLFRNTIFVVEDTMNPRFSWRMDIWMPNRTTAISFGVRKLRVTVVRLGRG
jgi:3D (Asp-Asp-Asp) domain-containing protein